MQQALGEKHRTTQLMGFFCIRNLAHKNSEKEKRKKYLRVSDAQIVRWLKQAITSRHSYHPDHNGNVFSFSFTELDLFFLQCYFYSFWGI